MTMSGPATEASRIDGLYELAFRRHQAGELREAEELYRSILAADARQLDCLYFLGMIALQDGRPDAAVDLIGQALAVNDRIAPYHGGMGEALRALGRRDEAIVHYRKAVVIDPGHWAAHCNLADVLRDSGDLDAAAHHYRQALAGKPDLAPALQNLAALRLAKGQTSEALEAAFYAVAANDTEDTRALFLKSIRGAKSLPGDPAFRVLLTRALSESWTRPGELAGAAVAVVKNEPAVAAGIQLAMASWPRRLSPVECSRFIGGLAGDELLRAVLDSTPVCDAGLERLLTSVRTILIDAAVNAQSDVSPEMIAFSCSLARQCFINEYVFDVSDTERQASAWLRNSVSTALTGKTPVFAIHLIALASFMPLQGLDRGPALLGRTWPDPVKDLITEHVREPQAETALRAAMPRLTAITEGVSAQVRQQDEEGPSPRWMKIGPVRPESSIAAYLRAEFPHAPLREAPETEAPEILIAGCGTGQQSLTAALRFPQARVLAIDLSLANLAYAKRKSARAGVTIEYGQADIVGLALPGRSFDAIEASGVLHHLADPMQGWSALLRLLKPGGFMRLGLYSELGRAEIAAARQLIAERGYGTTAEEIRRCRQDLISANDPRLAKILLSPDFYSTGTCRDLLFHVQEHHLTLPRIGAFLSEQRLTFLGFELAAPALAKYHERFPEDASMTDLAHWHRFETENPDTFRGMYNFWAQKEL